MKKYLLLLTVVLAFCTKCSAQKIKLLDATRQDWAGGIAGHTGSNYNFVIECSDYDTEPIPRVIWLGDEQVVIVTKDSLVQSNTVITRSGKKVCFTIKAGTFRDEYAEREQMIRGADKGKNKQHPPVAYQGVAMLVYTYKGAERYFIIPKILTQLETLNYP